MAAGSPRSAGSEGGRAPAAARDATTGRGASLPLTGGGWLPLLFIIGGLVAFGLAAAWLAGVTRAGMPPLLHPGLVAAAHLWLPGFLLSVCLGATYQLMPVVMGEPIRLHVSWLWSHAAGHLAGVAALVGGLAVSNYALAGAGGLAVAAGTGVLVLATLRTFRHSRRRDAAAWSFVFAAGWLLCTVLMGVVLAFNRRHGFLPLSTVDLMRAHAHLGLLGYFTSLLQGVTFQLVPMFTMGEARRPRLALTGLIATQAALPILAAGLAWGIRGLTVSGALAATAGLACTASALMATLATRRRRKLEPGIRAFLAGMVLLGVGGVSGLALALGAVGAERLWAAAAGYGLVVVVGGLSLTVLGILAKILPFLVWMKAYGPRVGRAPVPVATALSSRRMEDVWFAVHLIGLAAMLAGALLENRTWTLAGSGLLAAGALVWLGNAARILGHLRARDGFRETLRSPSSAAAVPAATADLKPTQ
jgi:hypothetical protein